MSRAEFYVVPLGESPAYLLQFADEQFRRWDRNHDGGLSSDEFDFRTADPTTPRDDFRRRDGNQDEQLSLEEYLTYQAADQHARLKRDFGVIDFDRNGRLSWDEFRAHPGIAPIDRGPVPDPLQDWADEQLRAWKDLVVLHAKNQAAGLAQSEWPLKELQKWGPIGDVDFPLWDADRNGVVSTAEARGLIELAFGIRRGDGIVLRFPTGGVIDLLALAFLDANQDGFVSLSEFSSRYGTDPKQATEIFNRRDRNQNGRWEWDEITFSSELVSDALGAFLHLDADLDGLVSQSELDARAHDWQTRLTRRLVVAFDDDSDGSLSFLEYRKTPVANQNANWYDAGVDRDFDGKLSLAEFYAPAADESPGYAIQFAYEQFRRWDRNHDGKLSSDEYNIRLRIPQRRGTIFVAAMIIRMNNCLWKSI